MRCCALRNEVRSARAKRTLALAAAYLVLGEPRLIGLHLQIERISKLLARGEDGFRQIERVLTAKGARGDLHDTR